MKNKKYPARKLKWKDIQITRVKLNPEQAVLACCAAAARGAVTGGGGQCFWGTILCGTSYGGVSAAAT